MMKLNFRRLAGTASLLALLPLVALAEEKTLETPKDQLPDPVAIVEGEKISRAELEESFTSVLASSGINPNDLSPEQKMTGYREILDELIIDKLVSRKASSVEITDEELAAEVARVKGQFPNEEVFAAEMNRAGETETSFPETVKTMMQQQKWMKSQIGDKDEVSDADVQKFYEENKKEFQHPELVRASHILILVPEDASDEVVAEKKKEATAALERVTTNKEDFAAVVKDVSEEPGAAERGGDLDFFPKDRMVPEFANAAFGMEKGQISEEPVRTKFGWHVIMVTDKKEAGDMPIEEAQEQVTNYLVDGKRRETVRSVIDNLRAEAKVENNLPAAPATPAAPSGS